jgi:hypothetical protein
MEQLTSNHFFINLILSSFAYAYILYQLKRFILKTDDPYKHWDYLGQTTADVHPLTYYFSPLKNTPATNIGIGLFTSLVFLVTFLTGISDPKRSSVFEIIFTIILIGGTWLVITFATLMDCQERYVYQRYAVEGGYFIRDLLHFLVFEAFCFVLYFTLEFDIDSILRSDNYNKDSLVEAIGYSHLLSAFVYLLANFLIYCGRITNPIFRIIIVLICLVLCMSGKFSILGWEF